jgi:hypothetical protein
MPKSAIGGKEAHDRWGNDADLSIVNDLPWSEFDIYQIAAGSLNSASQKMSTSSLGSRSPQELAHAYDHIRRLAYRGTQDFIETTLHKDLATDARRSETGGDSQRLSLDAGETQYEDLDADEASAPGSQASTFAELMKEDWQACVAPNSLYAWDSPAAYTAALFGEITSIGSAQDTLAKRRPDIAGTLITRDSIEHESHELERVIKILGGSDGGSSKTQLATTYFHRVIRHDQGRTELPGNEPWRLGI